MSRQAQAVGPSDAEAPSGELAANIVRFVRVLRRAGLPLGADKALAALAAVQVVGVERRDDFRYALNAVLVMRHEQQAVFDQAYALFWRNPEKQDDLQSLLRQLGSGLRKPDASRTRIAPRVAQALWPQAANAAAQPAEAPPELELDAAMSLSSRELLQTRDFAAMSPAEMDEARQLMRGMRLALPLLRTRRQRSARQGRVDMRNSLRQMLKSGGELMQLRFRTPAWRAPALVILCDISGSMDSYSRMLLHFVHALSNDRSRVFSFLFGTRLTNITRSLRGRDVDLALARVAGQVRDWAGGTRIAACLHAFNKNWGRRLLGQGAVVLLITDGLDSDDVVALDREMRLLAHSCRELIWLNPLLRYPAFEAKPAGIRAMLPHVHRFLPVHNLNSLAQLARILGGKQP